MKTTLALLVAIFTGVMAANAGDCDSIPRLGITAGIGASRYDATFGSLPGVPSCCSSYGGRWNFTWNIAAAIESGTLSIGELPLRLHLRSGVQYLGGVLQRDEFIGNVIVGDRATSGISRYNFDATIWAASLQPLLRMELPSAVAFDAGFRLDWIFSARYAQREDLISPAGNAVFETQSRVRNQSAGSIPTAASFGAALSAGMGYTIVLDSLWSFRPEIRGEVALTPVADVPWRIHRILIGAALMRRLLPRQPELPITPQPPPIAPSPPTLDATVELRGIHRWSQDTAIAEVIARRIVKRRLLVPVVFFEPGSDQLDSAAQTQLRQIARAARSLNLPLQLAPSTEHGEPDSLRASRFRSVRRLLIGEGVLVAEQPVQPPIPRSTTAAIADEMRAVWIKAPAPLVQVQTDQVTLSQPSVEVVIAARLVPPTDTATLRLRFAQDGIERETMLQPGRSTSIQLATAALLNGASSSFRWNIAAQVGNDHIERSGSGIVRVAFTERDTITAGSDDSGTLMLGRCSFDATTFDDLDTAVVALVRSAVARGATVTLIGSTDRIGTESYNRALARRRAEAAAALLALPPEAVRIEERIGGTVGNSMYDRLADRGVFVRIEHR
ncbi:MAG: hypothetical protein N3B17_02550 [Chlorobi bacterium]|nr:hypothetical protein [Chlorobiota bacterium]